MRKKLLIICFLWLSVLNAFGDTLAAKPKTLRVRGLGDPQTLDWNRLATWMDSLLIYNLMEGLVSVDSNLKPVAALAERWSASADNKTYTFFLRKNVKWSDGVELNAQQFIDSWERLLAPKTAARYASHLFDIEGAEAYNKGTLKDFSQVGVKALNSSTLQVKLRAAISYWYWFPSFYVAFPIRKELIEKDPTQWDRAGKMVSIGPFILSAHEPGRRIILKKNPNYYGKRGNIDEVAVALIHDDATAFKLYEVDQVDFVANVPPMERKRLKGRADVKMWPDLRTLHLRFNTNQNPTSNLAVRRAVAMSIDRSKLMGIFEGQYQPAGSFVPPGLMGYSKNPALPFDPEKARHELKNAGLDPTKMPPLNLLTIAFDDHVIHAQFIQEELKRNLGLNVKIHILEPKRYYSPLLNHEEYSMQINQWGADYPDPDNFYSSFLRNSAFNYYAWNNSNYDKLIAEARSISSKTQREKSYNAAQKILLEKEAATVPLSYAKMNGLLRPRIKGFQPGAMSWWFFKDLSIVKEE